MTASMAILLGAALVIVPFLALQFRMLQKSQAMVGSSPSFPEGWERLSQGVHVLWFHSTGCGPCMQMESSVRGFVREGKILRVDIQRDEALARQLGVMATPTTVVVVDGEVRQVAVGMRDRPELQALVGGPALVNAA